MSYQIHKKLIHSAALTVLAIFLGAFAANASYLPYVVELDGAQAGTSSTGYGTAAAVLDEDTSALYLRLQVSALGGQSNGIDNMARIVNDSGTSLGPITMISERASDLNVYSFSGANRTLLNSGQIRIVVRSDAFPSGEIAGTFRPFPAISGRIKGTFVAGDNPAVDGFASFVYNRAMNEAFLFYNYGGAVPGNSVAVDGVAVMPNVGAAETNLVHLDLSRFGTDFFERLRTGKTIVGITGRQGRGIPKPTGRQLEFAGFAGAEPTVFRPSTGVFYWRDDSGLSSSVHWGSPGDVPVPADFDADGRGDLAIWRPSTGTFYVYTTETNTVSTRRFGMNGDVPLTGDYDGDGRADMGVFRRGPNNGQSSFWIRPSNGGLRLIGFGLGNDIALNADFDGDLIADVAVWRPSDGTFYSIDSSTGGVRIVQWGINGDQPVVADYDGDAKSDFAVARKENGQLVWYVLNSRTNYATFDVRQFGVASAVPQPADYDGDGRADLAVYNGGQWQIRSTNTGLTSSVSYGLPTDIPLH